MRAFAVDTLELSDKFHKAGLNQKISKVLASEIKTAQENSIGNLVTKNDLKLVKKDIENIDNKIDSLEDRMNERFNTIDEKFNTMKQEIKTSMLTAIISMGGIITVATGFLGWLIKS